jgi:hypothetical protein
LGDRKCKRRNTVGRLEERRRLVAARQESESLRSDSLVTALRWVFIREYLKR